MNAIKNVLVITLLLGVAYGVYSMVNKPVETPPDVDGEIPSMHTDISMGKLSEAPPYLDDKPGALQSPTTAPEVRSGGVAPRFAGPPSFPKNGDSTRLAGRITEIAPKISYPTTASSSLPPIGRSAEVKPLVAGRKRVDAASFSAAWMEAQRLLDENDLVQAHRDLSEHYGLSGLSVEDDKKLTRLLSELAGTVIYSGSQHLLFPPYQVRQGETLQQIAAKHQVTPELLAKINGLSKTAPLRSGDKLKVVQGPFDAVVNLSRQEISLMLDGRFAGRFEVIRTGRDFSLPETTTVEEIVKKFNTGGEYFIGWGSRQGIHADNPNVGSGRDAYHSIVVNDRDAPELYDILSRGSKIEIRESNNATVRDFAFFLSDKY